MLNTEIWYYVWQVQGTKLIKNLLKIGTDSQNDETPMTIANQQPLTKKRMIISYIIKEYLKILNKE